MIALQEAAWEEHEDAVLTAQSHMIYTPRLALIPAQSRSQYMQIGFHMFQKCMPRLG